MFYSEARFIYALDNKASQPFWDRVINIVCAGIVADLASEYTSVTASYRITLSQSRKLAIITRMFHEQRSR